MWTTQLGEPVGVGDVVALSLYGHPDALARVSGVTGEGNPTVECRHCNAELAVLDLHLAAVLRAGNGLGVGDRV